MGEVTQWARGMQSPATVPSEDTAQVLSATPTQRGSASRGRSRTQGKSPDRPAIPSQGRSVSQLPMRSASLCLAKCASLWRSECLVRCAMMLRSSTMTMEPELLVVEPELGLLLAPELEQDMDMDTRHQSHTFCCC